jgi:hypothetical protein
MPLPKLIPALGDLMQDIAGPLPVELFREWVSGNQNVDKASELLQPFAITGTVVATDSSGLSSLMNEMDLLDVLALVSRPKEIVHALGTDVGGRAIGTWVADNTEMHYLPETPLRVVIGAMVEVHERIKEERAVKIGMCIHEGAFYEIAGGLYGRDAAAVEHLAERFAAPGETLLTGPVAARAKDFARFEARKDLDVIFGDGVFTLSSAVRLPYLRGDRIDYPHPFPDDFFQSLLALRGGAASDELRAGIYQSLLQERVIVVLTRQRDATEAASVTSLLDNLVANAVMEAIVNQAVVAREHVASLGGGFAILSFTDAQQAVDMSMSLRDRFVESGLPVKIGIDAGRVLMFARQRGPSGISGSPVNMASKISEDVGIVNMVSITTRVADHVRGLEGAAPFTARISNVGITGVRV